MDGGEGSRLLFLRIYAHGYKHKSTNLFHKSFHGRICGTDEWGFEKRNDSGESDDNKNDDELVCVKCDQRVIRTRQAK